MNFLESINWTLSGLVCNFSKFEDSNLDMSGHIYLDILTKVIHRFLDVILF